MCSAHAVRFRFNEATYLRVDSQTKCSARMFHCVYVVSIHPSAESALVKVTLASCT